MVCILFVVVGDWPLVALRPDSTTKWFGKQALILSALVRSGVVPDVRRGTKPSNYPDHPPLNVGGFNRVRAQGGQGGDCVAVRRGG